MTHTNAALRWRFGGRHPTSESVDLRFLHMNAPSLKARAAASLSTAACTSGPGNIASKRSHSST